MKHKRLRFGAGFRVGIGNRRSQAAEMVLAPGAAEGDSSNRHRGADQWLYVASGRGTARINGKRYTLRAGMLMLIERGDRHEIKIPAAGSCGRSTFTSRRPTTNAATRCRAAGSSAYDTPPDVVVSRNRFARTPVATFARVPGRNTNRSSRKAEDL